ncbi:hypothetical protein BH20ACI4_BH20ACI4_20750 [soil metagenome]
MQTRSFNSSYLSNDKRYHWLSVPRLISRSANVTLHFAGWRDNISGNEPKTEDTIPSKTILITERAIKADAVRSFQNAKPILGKIISPVGNSGIGAAHGEIIHYCRNKEILLAFDQDFQTNAKVEQAIKKLLLLFEKSKEPPKDLKILVWNQEANGIDEALQSGVEISALTATEWHQTFK